MLIFENKNVGWFCPRIGVAKLLQQGYLSDRSESKGMHFANKILDIAD